MSSFSGYGANLNVDKARTQLFKYLDEGLALSHKKLHTKRKDEEICLKWGRLMVNMISVYGKLMETEELEQRVLKLEELIKDSVVIPNEQNPKRKNH